MKSSGFSDEQEASAASGHPAARQWTDGDKRVASRLIVSCGTNGIADDFCRFLDELSGHRKAISANDGNSESCPDAIPLEDSNTEFQQLDGHSFVSQSFDLPFCPDEIVVFLGSTITARTLQVIGKVSALASAMSVRCVVVVPSLLTHLSVNCRDHFQSLLDQLGSVFDSRKPGRFDSGPTGPSTLIVVRTGYVLSRSSKPTRRIRLFRPLKNLLADRLTTTFVEDRRLFAAINEELISPPRPIPGHTDAASSNIRQITLLGDRRAWHNVLASSAPIGSMGRAVDSVAKVLSLIGFKWLLFGVFQLLRRFCPSLRQLHYETLRPKSVAELLSLYNRHNCADIQIAGYNNGVNHFGWKFPTRTVVVTTGLPGRTFLSDASVLDLESYQRESVLQEPEVTLPLAQSVKSGTHLTVDAGLTLNHCIRELNTVDREFYVIPNYSWISMGTLFFVPVHGSGSRVSTLGDTIEDVLFFDGDEERFVHARRGDAVFRDAMYNTHRSRLLLRLTLRVKPRSKYFVQRSKLDNPTAEEVQQLFADPEASNVEVRKSQAGSTSIDVSRYYIDTVANGQETMEMPRDNIGHVWDRLEETPVVSTLFHWFVRRFAFHVELFLKPDEFEIFWKHHGALPVSKIQLRRVLKDGMTHSACEHHDCISADLFMTRRNRDVFCKFVTKYLPNVRSNPGKQSL